MPKDALTGQIPLHAVADDDVPKGADVKTTDDADSEGPPTAPVTPEGSAVRRRSPRTWDLQEFFIPIHGLVRVDKAEVDIIDHPAFQHLGYVYQLGQTYLVYRGATHTRYEHALGTRHVIELLIEALHRNSRKAPDRWSRGGDWVLDEPLRPVEMRFVRLGALLHDIGHIPAGHTLEDELGLLGAHDAGERLAQVWDRPKWNGVGVAKTLRQVIDERFAEDARASGLQHAGGGAPLTATEIVELLISKDQIEVDKAPDFRTAVCRDLIGNTICADLLDYLHRDWYHIGKERFFDSRLLEYMEIRRNRKNPGDARLVINLRSGHKIRTDAVTAILDLLESRYQLAEIALFHRTKNSAAAMLERAIAEIGGNHPDERDSFLDSLQDKLLDATDTELLSILGQAAAEALAGGRSKPLDPDRRGSLEGAARLTHDLRIRNLHRELVSHFAYELHRATELVQDMYSGAETTSKDALQAKEERRASAQEGAAHRLQAVRRLETDFEMAPGSVVMYCPPRSMNTKIAEVQVLINGHVYALDKFETTNRDRGITGGHLAAQKDRFRRLWRVQFAVRRDELERLKVAGLDQLLGRAIELCVLGLAPSVGTVEEARDGLAEELAKIKANPRRARDLGVARAARQEETLYYPTGVLSLSAGIE